MVVGLLGGEGRRCVSVLVVNLALTFLRRFLLSGDQLLALTGL